MRLENAQQAAAAATRDGLSSRQQANEQNHRQDELLSPTQTSKPTTTARATTAKPSTTTTTTRARTLSNLFRSKSMRIISTSGGNNNHLGDYRHQHQQEKSNQQAATIDYLSTARPHKRSLSINRNHSTSFFGPTAATDNNLDATSQKNLNIAPTGTSGGKLVHFLRKLFRTKRNKPVNRRHQEEHETEEMRQAVSHQPVDNSRIIINNIHTTTTTTTTTTANNNNNNDENFHSGGAGKQQLLLRRSANLLSSPSSDSSASNSLIEILDCSPAVNQSRRALREQHLVRERNRASWRMVQQRSDSSLSELSDCSTTASEQLRRHLDEAYKRHRNERCTSQREKEFIDSINVLRQASRHALPQSGRSSSKTRHAASKSVASGKSDIETVSSLTGSQSTANESHDSFTSHHLLHAVQPHQQPHHLQHQPHTNCCICASYLDSVARLCPLVSAATTYCPSTASATCCPVLTPTSPISLPLPPPPPPLPLALSNGAGNGQQAGGNPAADMCMCPLWRSMISNYSSGCQSAADSPPLIFNPITNHHHLQQQQQHQSPANQQHLLLTAHSPQPLQTTQQQQQQHHHQQQQQQHHNTTIDLKIEIGAELAKQTSGGGSMKIAGTNSRRSFNRKHHHNHHQQQQPKVEVDSLDSDYTTNTSTASSS